MPISGGPSPYDEDAVEQWYYPGCVDCTDEYGQRVRLEQTRRTSSDRPLSGRTIYECPQCGAEYVLTSEKRYRVKQIDRGGSTAEDDT